jgi:hypothetical protein
MPVQALLTSIKAPKINKKPSKMEGWNRLGAGRGARNEKRRVRGPAFSLSDSADSD